MQTGFVVPHADAREFSELATLGEEHGWDGVFTWEAVWGVDAWVSLTAAAMVTKRIRLGTLLTPVARIRPWDLASRVGTLDRLSDGRVTVSAGLGAVHDGWTAFEADEGRRTRAEQMDECLAIFDGLMRGQPFEFSGRHYQVSETDFMPPDPPLQRPHPPVWIVGAQVVGHDHQPSLERAARWNGLIPQVITDGQARHVDSPDELATMLDVVRDIRSDAGLTWDSYDVVIEADSHGDFVDITADNMPAWRDAGATWWIESWWDLPRDDDGLAEVRRRITLGPPGRAG